MFLHPTISRELARERQRDLLVQAHHDRLARQARQAKAHTRVAKLRPQPRQHLRRALRSAAALLRTAPQN